jgi:nicotinamide riboside transporter PnuC
MPRIFGREPALWLALVAVGVKLLTAFGLDVSADQQSVINAVAAAFVGVVVAVMVHDGISAAVLGLVQSAVALAVGFGLDWSADQQAVVMSAAAAIVGMFVRTQVTAPVVRRSVDLAA